FQQAHAEDHHVRITQPGVDDNQHRAGGGQDFGLAAAIATLIFLLVGALAIVNLKATRMKFD
ncbi:hypothetical protein, partial [Escherichia coli]|uniref:hypothetical protein n=1 Tax=Escherichia coli TaxID=562 RepID=UPI000ABD6C57